MSTVKERLKNTVFAVLSFLLGVRSRELAFVLKELKAFIFLTYCKKSFDKMETNIKALIINKMTGH